MARTQPIPWPLEASDRFSMSTCVGCHAGETGTAFFHVTPRKAGEAAKLSTFLRTDGSSWRMRDPATKRRVDSAEMEDRERLLESILNPGLPYREVKALKEGRKRRDH